MGAPSNRLLELSKRLREDNWEVMIITAMPNYPKGEIFESYKGKFSAEESISGMRILRYWLYASISSESLPRIISMSSFSATSFFSLPEVRKFKPDYIFTESPPLTLSFTGYLLSKFSASKLIMNVSDIWPLSAKELGKLSEGFLYRQIEKLEKFLYRKSFLCSGQSEEIVTHINKSSSKKAYLFRNGVDINRFKKPTEFVREKENVKIVYAGLLGVAQGIYDIAVNIDFSELGAEFHIYGEGTEKNKLEKFLIENPGRNIYLHNSIGRDEIPGLLSEFYCTLIPLIINIYGAVPSKIYEAMAAGLPVLFSGSGEGARIIDENEAGFVSGPKDYENLKRNILRLKNNPSERNKISANCRAAAEKKFDRNKLADDFAEELRRLKEK